MNFHDTYASLTMTRAEEHNCVRLRVEEVVHLELDAIRRAKEKEENAHIEDEETANLVEQSRLKYGEEEFVRLEAE